MEELTGKIARYLADEMSEQEKYAFELELEKDSKLREELELQRKTVALLEKAAEIELRERVKSINTELSEADQSGIIQLKPLLRIAAVLVILLVPTYFYVQSLYNDQALYTTYAEPYPDRITHMGESGNDAMENAMVLYNGESYAEAAQAFEKIRLNGVEDEQIALYEAVSLTYSDQSEKAITLLENCLSESVQNRTAFEWQLILAYLAAEKGDLALPLLQEFLKHNEGYQQANAEALIKDLESFWR